MTIDGADQIAPDGWLVKGGGAAHTREKLVAVSGRSLRGHRRLVEAGAGVPRPVPLELLEFGLAATLHRLGNVTLRDVPRSPDGGVIADYHGLLTDPQVLALLLDSTPGVVDHGLFPPSMVATVIVARGDEIEHREISAPTSD